MKRIRAIATSTQQLNKKGQQWFHSPSMVTPCCRSSSKLNKVWNTPRIWHQHRQFSTFVDNDGSTSIFVGTEEEQGCLRGHRQAQQQDEDDDICKKTDRFVNTDASFEEAMIGPRITDGFTWQNLYDEAHEMMMAAFVSYPMTFILREAKAGRLKHSEKVLEKLHAGNDGNMATSVHPVDFVDVVRDNIDYIAANYPFGDKNFGWYSTFQLYQQMTRPDHPDDIALMEFDDKQDSTRLVYGIGVNKPLKRITVIFRGTYAEQTRDMARNLQFNLIEVQLPEAVVSAAAAESGLLGDPTSTKLFVHRGIYEYLLHNSERGPDYPRERYEEIVGHLLTCLKEYPGYKIFVTGHSLGGALALMLAFFLACDERIPKPVSSVSLGSLLVGDKAFQTTFERLERLGWIRHLRITNEHDPIPNLPPFTWYQPVGMHLNLRHGKGFEVIHASKENDSELLSGGKGFAQCLHRLWLSYQEAGNSLDKFVEWHMMPAYLRRLERNKDALKELSLNECYRSKDYVASDFETKL